MESFRRILFPVDFTAPCERAAPYVASFARCFKAEVILLHCQLPDCQYYWEVEKEGRSLAQGLEEFLASELTGINVRRLIQRGEPAETIVSCVNNEKADLIMMPTHGRGPFRRFLLGSVTNKVLHDAPCPVWTSAHLDRDRPRVPTELRNILCAVSLDDSGIHTLRYAGGFARRIGATLTVAHAVPAVAPQPETYIDWNLQQDLMERARLRLAEMQAVAETNAIVCVGTGNIARFVNHAAQSHTAGLVIIGRGGNGLLGRLRTHGHGIIRESEHPVLIV